MRRADVRSDYRERSVWSCTLLDSYGDLAFLQRIQSIRLFKISYIKHIEVTVHPGWVDRYVRILTARQNKTYSQQSQAGRDVVLVYAKHYWQEHRFLAIHYTSTC